MSPKETIQPDTQKESLDLLATLFGSEEARKCLLGIVQVKSVSPDQVLRDAQALELMMRTFPWRIYNEALWRKLMESLRSSLTMSYQDSTKQTITVTPEQREGYRYQVLAYLSVLHLPYELAVDKQRVEQMKKLEKEAQEANS